MLSTWIANKGLHCAMNIGMWWAQGRSEAGAWGILLADVVRNIAHANRGEDGTDSEGTIETVARALREELDEPTSEAKGSFQARPS